LEAAGEKQQAKTVRQQAGHRTLHKTWMFELDGMGDEYLATLSQAATTYAAYIDTRGYVHYRLGDNEAALRDLTTAVELADASSEYLQQSPAFRAFVANKTTPAEVRYEQRHHWDKSRAVLHYHRALVLQELGQSEQADADLRCVHELGAEPGPKLF
jgi:tetratricopeptide (TPR) repeat protein